MINDTRLLQVSSSVSTLREHRWSSNEEKLRKIMILTKKTALRADKGDEIDKPHHLLPQ